MSDIKMDVRAYPIDDPKGSTIAFASVAFKVNGEDLAAIRGIRIVDSEKGPFVSMPQSKDKNGDYHDIAHPLNGDLRKELNAAVFDEYNNQMGVTVDFRGYEKPEHDDNSGINPESVNLNVKVYPVREPTGSTAAFASVALGVDGEDIIAIRGLRVVQGEKGLFVSMPQSKDKDGGYHDVAFPLSGNLRKEINKAVVDGYKAADKSIDKKQSLDNKLRDGAAKTAGHKPASKNAAAKSRHAGLE